MIPSILVGSALLLLFSPWMIGLAIRLLGTGDMPYASPAALPAGPTYQSAIADLAHVRLRLLKTDKLDEPAKKAVDTLTLALVAGSDQ
jgi:hypothetical protein